MMRIKKAVCKCLSGLLICLLAPGTSYADSGQQKPFSPELYVFSNGLKGPFTEEAAQSIRKLGYHGVGSTHPNRLEEIKAGCDKAGLKVYSVYLDSKVNAENFQYGKDVDASIRILKGTDALLEINVQRGNNPNDEQAIAMIREIAGKAKDAGLKVVIYPHANFYIERIDHALKVVKATGCDNVGIAFNLCHFLKVQPKDNLEATLAEAKPLLWSVSICGADKDGNDWNTLIRPLDEGSFDLAAFLKQLRGIGYANAIGQQCYNIRIDPEENLKRSGEAWKKHLAASMAE